MRAPAASALLALSAVLAGCVGSPGSPAAVEGPDDGPSLGNVTAPTGRELNAFQETNRTEDGLGGEIHDHDYWKGRDRAPLLDGTFLVFPLPVFADGDGATSTTTEIVPARPNLVFEGTEHVEVLVTQEDPVLGAYPLSRLRLEYLSAADGPVDWRDGGPVAYGTPVIVPVAPEEADMPHSEASLWAFRLVSDGPHSHVVRVNATAVRGRDVLPWPGHPDFYAEKPWRVVHDGDATDRFGGYVDLLLYGDVRSWTIPDRLVSWGTDRLDVFVNVTRMEGPAGLPPQRHFLMVLNATSWDLPERFEDAEGRNDLQSYHFVVPVDAGGMDSPYAAKSRWRFNFASYYAELGNTAPYSVDYHLTVIATDEDWAPRPAT